MAEPITIRGIWAGMSEPLAATILSEVRGDTPEMYREVLANAAAAFKMRPQALRSQPGPRQAATIRRWFTQVNAEEPGGYFLIQWLTTRQKAMLIQFLDDLGLPHDEGTVQGEIGPEPEHERLTAAVAHLRESFPAEPVRVYLQAFAAITAEEWTGLPALIDP